MKNVLIINQSAELYGADKAILELINNFPENYTPIVVLHEEGPLKSLLEKKRIQMGYLEYWLGRLNLFVL